MAKRRLISKNIKHITSDPGALNPSGNFRVSDLKALLKQAKAYQAEEAVPQIRRAARAFKEQRSESQVQLADSSRILLMGSEEQIRRLIFKLNPAARLIRADSEFLRFRAPLMGMLPRLPKTYAFKGGAARLALQSVLGGKREMSAPRDLDVARIGGFASPLDKKVAARFMAEDFRHGDGVEVVKSLQHYFSSRDLTINEAIILAGQLVCTRRALSDCLMGILRLTDHLHRQSASERNKILIKALRIQAEQKVLSGRTWRLVEAAALKQVNPFHIAVHLGRALQCGKNAAEDFVRALMEAGVLSINPAGGLLEKALEDLRLLGLNGSLCQEISRLIAPDFSRAAAKPLIINQRLKAL